MLLDLTEILFVAERIVPRLDEIVALLVGDNPKVSQLYTLLKNNSYKYDKQVVDALGVSHPSYTKYAESLAKTLQKALLLFDADFAGFDESQKAIYGMMRDTAAMQIVTARNSRRTSEKIARHLLLQAEKFERPFEAYLAAEKLCDYASSFTGKGIDLDIHQKKMWEQKAWADLELQSRAFYYRFAAQSTRTKALKPELQSLTKEAIDYLKPHVNQAKSSQMHFHYYLLSAMHFLTAGDYAGAIEPLQMGQLHFLRRAYPARTYLGTFYHHEIVCCLMLGRYEQGEQAAQHAFKLAEPGMANWFSAHETYAYLCFHTGQYEKALDGYLAVTRHRRFASVRETTRELWAILGAHLWILVKSGELKMTAAQTKAFDFNPKKFLNEVPIFSEDRAGLNITVLFAQLIFLLFEKRFEEILPRLEALEKYRVRYLKDEATVRSRHFAKAMAMLPDIGYEAAIFLKKTKSAAVVFEKNQVQILNQSHELEILPYPVLMKSTHFALAGEGGTRRKAVAQTR